MGAREEGRKERKEQKGTQRDRRQGKDLIVEPYGKIIFPGKLSSWQFVRKHELRTWLVPGVKLLSKLTLEHECTCNLYVPLCGLSLLQAISI